MINKDINYYKKAAAYYQRQAQEYKAKADQYDMARENISIGTKNGIKLARALSKRIGAKPKYPLSSPDVQLAIYLFRHRQMKAKQFNMSIGNYIKVLTSGFHIPASTLYRLSRKYKGLPINPMKKNRRKMRALRQQEAIRNSQWGQYQNPNAPMQNIPNPNHPPRQ